MKALPLLLAIGLVAGCQKADAAAQPQPTRVMTEACGAKGQPDCPTQRWMKATLQSYQRNKDFDRLATAFDELATKEPTGYSDWNAIAKRGAEAARKKDADGVRETCRTCHDSLRDRFKQEMRQIEMF